MQVDLGLPDGVIGAAALRLHRYVHVHAGVGYNGISPGVRVGARAPLLDAAVTPYLAGEAGHYFAGDTTGWTSSLVARTGFDRAEIRTVGYSYASGHGGLQFGSPGAAVYIQAGVSWIRATATLLDRREPDMSPDPAMPPAPTVEVHSRATVSTVTLSGRIGLITYF